MLYSLIGEWMYRYGLYLIALGCAIFIILIIVYALFKSKIAKREYKRHLEKRQEEKRIRDNSE